MRLRLTFLSILLAAAPAAAQQQSQSYKFLDAIRKADGNAVIAILDQPGQTIINTRDIGTGESALHIVAKRGDATYANYLLARGADINATDSRGNTALMLAVEAGHADVVDILTARRADTNLGNKSGETPLLRAVQRRDLPLVRTLITAGANPDKTDYNGTSPRSYVAADPRAGAIAKVMAETRKKAPANVSGPRL